MNKVSLVLPVYNEEIILSDVLVKYIADLDNIRLKLGYEWEIVAVDDLSTDGSKLVLMDFARKYRNFKVVSLAKRTGKHAAVAAGFSVANGSIVMTAEIDLQNPMGLLENMLQEHLDSQVPIIYGYQEFTGWKKRKAFFTDRLTRFASKLFFLDGYFTGIVNCELYTADVADVLRQNPAKNKYMRTMNNWVGWSSKELWYAREYTDDEVKLKKMMLRDRHHRHTTVKQPGRENSGSLWYALLCVFLSVVAFTLGFTSLNYWAPVVLAVAFTLAFAFLVLALMFLLRSVLLRRVGNLNYRAGEIIYEIKSILNQ